MKKYYIEVKSEKLGIYWNGIGYEKNGNIQYKFVNGEMIGQPTL